jgi:integrase
MPDHLTNATVKRLEIPTKGNRITYDGDVAGFGLRVTAGGSRSFILNYRTKAGRERRITIGQFPNWKTVDARQEARRLRQEIDRGSDPLGELEDARSAPTMAGLFDRIEAEHVVRKRTLTANEYKRMLRLHIRPHFGQHTKVADVQFEDVEALHRSVTKNVGPYQANRVLALLSKTFNLAVKWRMRSDNPTRGVERNPEHKRQRYARPDELERLLAALNAHPDRQAVDVIRVLLLTGSRKGEVMTMRWSDVDLTTGKWTKPAASTKANRVHEIPLSAPARQLLAEIAKRRTSRKPDGFVFPSDTSASGHVSDVGNAWRRICKAAGITGLRVHDIRHSYSSQLASSGVGLHVIGALLGHTQPQTTHRYAHLFDDPLRAATEKVGAVIAGKASAEVVPLKGSR